MFRPPSVARLVPLLTTMLATLASAAGVYGGWRLTGTPTAAAAASAAASSPSRMVPRLPGPAPATQVAMRNVDFYVDPDVVLQIRRLRGTMTDKGGGVVLFDDKRSFVIHIASAEVGLSGASLSALMNKYVFAYRGAPLKRLQIRTSGSEIVQRGVLHKGIDIPFEIRAQLDVTPQGLIRLHPTRTRILGVNGDALMRALGLSLEKLLDLRRARGVTVHGNDLFLDPTGILPPPVIDGRVTAVRVEGDDVVQVFERPTTGPSTRPLPPLIPPDPTAPNFMYYKGGTLRFGRLLMLDAEMQIVDLDPSDPFHFDLDRYNAQLIAGYSRTLPDLGLEVYMRDIDKVRTAGKAPVPRALLTGVLTPAARRPPPPRPLGAGP